MSAAFYLPTVIKLIRVPDAWRCQSTVSWAGWTLVATNACLYACLVNQDPFMIGVTGMGVTCNSIVVSILLFKRFRAHQTRHASLPIAVVLDIPAAAEPLAA